MGIFSQEVLQQSTFTESLIADTPELLKPSVIKSVMDNTDIVGDLLDNVSNCYAGNVRRYWMYGRDHFTNGLPEGTIGSMAVDNRPLQAVIDKLFPVPEGHRNRIDVALYDRYQFRWFYNESVRNQTYYDPQIVLPTKQTDFDEMVTVAISPAFTMDRERFSFTLSVRRQYISSEGNWDIFKNIPLTTRYPMDEGVFYYYVVFQQVDADGTEVGLQRYWVYDVRSGDEPTISVPEATPDTQYLPIVPLRINNQSLTGEEYYDTDLYRTSKKLLKRLDLDINQLHEGVNENPDIDQVDHAYVVLGISIHTEQQESKRYLFAYFDDLSYKSKTSPEAFKEWEKNTPEEDGDWLTGHRPPPVNTIEISDGTYKTLLIYNYIERFTVAGNIGSVGTCAVDFSGFNIRSKRNEYHYQSSTNQMILTKQVTPTQTERLVVAGGIFYNVIFGAAMYGSTYVDDDKNNFLIPINLDVFTGLPILVRNAIAYDALKVVMQSYEYVKLKWYETGFFKFVTTVVAVALTIYTGSDFGLSSLVAAASAGAIAFLQAILIKALVVVAISIGFKFVASKLGAEFAAILAIALSVTGALADGAIIDLPFADQLTMIGTEGLKAAMATGMEEISLEFDRLNDLIATKTDELKAANEYLSSGSELIDPSMFMQDIGMVPSEPFDNFYARASMVNGGSFANDLLYSAYDRMLTLPSLEI